MRNLLVPALAALSVFSCALSAPRAQAETFSLTAGGYDPNTGLTTAASFTLMGTADAVAGAYDLTGGSGLVVMTSNSGAVDSQTMTLYLPSGTSAAYQTANFQTPGQPSYEYNNVVYPGGTQLNVAGGSELDQYGLLFTSATEQFNLFGQSGYGFTNGSTVYNFNSPLQTFALTDTTATGVTPEPSSIALLGTGLLGAAGLVRRRFHA